MYEYYNPNPKADKVGDCVVRALTRALGKNWNTVYVMLSMYGYSIKDMPSANRVWGRLLNDKGYTRHIVDCDCTVAEFADTHPTGLYILAIQGHVVCVADGKYCDSWDSGNEVPLYYWKRG